MKEKKPSITPFLFLLLLTFIGAIYLTLTGCQSVQVPAPSPEAKTAPVVDLPWGKKPAWEEPLFLAIEQSGLAQTTPRDIKEFCPGYESLKAETRVQFWAQLVGIIAKYESSFKPETKVAECRKNSCVYQGGCQYSPAHGYCMKGGHSLDGGIVISRGLLQISLQSGKGFGCDLEKPEDLHAPGKNLVCGVKILSRFVIKDQRVAGKVSNSWQGAAKYWAVFRGTTDYTKKSLEGIKAHTSKLPFCAKGI